MNMLRVLWEQFNDMLDKAIMWVLQPFGRYENFHDALYCLFPVIVIFALGGIAQLIYTYWSH